MKKSPHEMVQRTCGRDTTLEVFNGRGFFRMPWEGAGAAANDVVFEGRRVG
jgi:hypothetical protein